MVSATVGIEAVFVGGVAVASDSGVLVAQATSSTVATAGQGSLDPIGTSASGVSVFRSPTQQERRRVARLRRCLRVLKPTDRRVLSLRYGLGGGQASAVDVVAERTGLSISRVQGIERRALPRLRRAVAAGQSCGDPAPAAAPSPVPPGRATASHSAGGPASSSRREIGLGLFIVGLTGLAGVLVYTLREIRRSL
jgi:hypothetical protein